MKMTRIAVSLAALSVLLHAQAPATPNQSRLLCLFFDLNAMDASTQTAALQSAVRFVQQQAQPTDRIAVMTYNSQLNVVQDFTAGPDAALAALRTIMPANTGQPAGAAAQLQAIRSAISALGGVSQKKALIYFSSGIQTSGALTQDAVQANIAVYPVDARGLPQ